MDLTGVWIGETIGIKQRTHHWIIIQRGDSLRFYTRWEDEDSFVNFGGFFTAPDSFKIRSMEGHHSEIINENQFEIMQWIYRLKGTELVPHYDVAFQRRETGLLGAIISLLARLFAGNQTLMRWIC
jgi:hypothetical protein